VGAHRAFRRPRALVIFVYVETKVAEPLFRISLFRIRAFTAGNIVPAAHESLGYELAAVAGEGGFEPSELVVPGVPEESTEPPDKPD
jgi:hypothetical protein